MKILLPLLIGIIEVTTLFAYVDEYNNNYPIIASDYSIEKNEYKNAYEYHEEAKMLFDLSKENPALSRNQQFSSWVERNAVAMAKVENLLKK